MKTNFPKLIDAVAKIERSQWSVADALLDETTGKLKGERGMKAASAALEEQGYNYHVRTLLTMRLVAKTYPEDRRHRSLGFSLHQEAANPDMLDACVAAAKDQDVEISWRFVRKTINTIRSQRTREHRAKTGRKPPPQRRSKAPAPKAEDMPLLVVSEFDAAAGTAAQMARKALKNIKSHIADLKQSYRAGLAEAAMEAANEWLTAARALGVETRSHIQEVKKAS